MKIAASKRSHTQRTQPISLVCHCRFAFYHCHCPISDIQDLEIRMFQTPIYMLDTFKYEFSRHQTHISNGSSTLSKILRNWCALVIKDNRQCQSFIYLALFLNLSLARSLSFFPSLPAFVVSILFCFLNWQHFVSAQLHSHSIYFIFRTPISGQQWYFSDNYTNICCCCRRIQKN